MHHIVTLLPTLSFTKYFMYPIRPGEPRGGGCGLYLVLVITEHHLVVKHITAQQGGPDLRSLAPVLPLTSWDPWEMLLLLWGPVFCYKKWG